jgi:hypothetical protein
MIAEGQEQEESGGRDRRQDQLTGAGRLHKKWLAFPAPAFCILLLLNCLLLLLLLLPLVLLLLFSCYRTNQLACQRDLPTHS